MVLVVTITGGNTQHIISYYSIAIVLSTNVLVLYLYAVCRSYLIRCRTMSLYVHVLYYCIALYCIVFFFVLHWFTLCILSYHDFITHHIIRSPLHSPCCFSVKHIYIRLPSISSLACFHFFSSNKHRKVTVDSGTSRRDHTKFWSTSYQNGGVQALDLIPRFGCVYKLYSRKQYTID